jgi:hypothetical protein
MVYKVEQNTSKKIQALRQGVSAIEFELWVIYLKNSKLDVDLVIFLMIVLSLKTVMWQDCV